MKKTITSISFSLNYFKKKDNSMKIICYIIDKQLFWS